MSIQEALWAVYNNDHHRLENFSNFLRLTGAPQTADKDRTVQQLQKKLLTWNGRCDHVLLAVAIYNWLYRRLLQLSHRLQLSQSGAD